MFLGDDVKPSFLSYSLNCPIDRILLPKHKVVFLGYDGRPDAHHMLIVTNSEQGGLDPPDDQRVHIDRFYL